MTDNLHLVHILLVEDNETDILIAREALNEVKVLNEVHVARDGEEAMRYLRREGEHQSVVRPDLVLLDLNLPRKHGLEVLREIKEDPELRLIPVVVLTTSKAEEDVVRAYGLHANSYVTKPLSFEAFGEVLGTMKQFWLCVVTLPSRDR